MSLPDILSEYVQKLLHRGCHGNDNRLP